MSSTVHSSTEEKLIDQAASWMARLWSDDATKADQQACDAWRQAAPEHEQAWQNLLKVTERFNAIPTPVGKKALLESPHNQSSRRQLLQWLGVMLTSSGLGLGISKTESWQQAFADYQTVTGEIRSVQLADGTEIILNTATAIDVTFNHQQRLIQLHHGEIEVTTGHDSEYQDHSLLVQTAHGRIQALGTQFTVRQSENETQVCVTEGAVEITTKQDSSQKMQLHAGEQSLFSSAAMGQVEPMNQTSNSWQQGLLVAEQMRVAAFCAELSRYRNGLLRCDPRVADLQVSGVFSVRDTDKALHNLTLALPVKVIYRTGLWVSVVPDT
ncbi:iron dicitrate transport regulator FecR [Methylophaga nitratireducenticrescens]|uniref:Transmembrane sensor n=1 Tax=Methylophaga nitratireducenticrescens TaxID=754476 RepID=I1XF76_METNJ|nr:FecR domain-containing protein [Methylophaga nitratireducenticrescens]AFI83045.1 iron dicitrate transport regulator FecR [Methylophaga nitratireducenticrescens]